MDSQKDKLKLEKLTAAIYLVTNFLPDLEPVKWRLRDSALSILPHLSVPDNSIGQLLSPVEQILSLINIARLNPGVSQMNWDILQQEYSAMRDKIKADTGADLLADLPTIEPAIASGRQRQVLPNKQNNQISEPARAGIQKAPNNSRRELVYRIIKQQGPISIKDIARAVPGVSSKTVQRELSELVRAGQLKREGERRWSRYSAL
jgi:DNA-binding transcriptional ArsR family regulator